MARRRKETYRDESFSSDSDEVDDPKCCIKKKEPTCLKIPCLDIGKRMKSCTDRMECGLSCLTPLNAACFSLYILLGTGLLGFLLLYRDPLWNFLRQITLPIFHAILPTSWMKSTYDIVDEALAMYSADRIGRADYALESSGGSILCSSDTYYTRSGALYSIFGIPLWYHSSSPREVIQPDVQPGNCWAMDGHKGYVMIKLAMPVIVLAVSLEHIPQEVSQSGRLDSAPKQFRVFGKEKSMDSPDVLLGDFIYRTDLGQPIQYFLVKDPYCIRQSVDHTNCGPNQQVFNIIKFSILSNHGNSEFTCIYRLRVHGKPPDLLE